MPKRSESGRACLSEPVRMDLLLSHVLRDASRYTDVSALAATLVTDITNFRKKVGDSLHQAVLHLDEGGFIRYTVLRQIEALLKKNASFFALTPDERRRKAIAKFQASERSCYRANRRLAHFSKHWSRAPLAMEILNDAKSLIYSVLGEFDNDLYEEVLKQSCFGSGSTFDESRAGRSLFLETFSQDEGARDTSRYARLTKGHTITKGAVGIFADYVRSSNLGGKYIAHQERHIVRGDRVAFVPKNWDVDRTIAIQPSLNVYFQKGVDLLLKRFLRSVGIDLRDQTLNHVPAGVGSVNGQYCTVDLSSASDTVSIGIVEHLFPKSWCELFKALRCEEYTTDQGKTWTTYQKFSSMGNAFTFPVETFIFWAIAKVCCARCGAETSMLQVYGDDIVVDRRAYLLLREVLLFAGFEVNAEKSYAFSSFRETCGCDFVFGVDVRPVYLKKVPTTVPEVYSLYNRLLANRVGLQFPDTLHYLQSLVKNAHFGPFFIGGEDWYAGKDTVFDGYFIGEPPEGVWDLELMTRTFKVTCLARRPKRSGFRYSELRHYLTVLLGERSDVVERNDRFTVFTRHYTISRWPTLKEAAAMLDRDRRRLRDVW